MPSAPFVPSFALVAALALALACRPEASGATPPPAPGSSASPAPTSSSPGRESAADAPAPSPATDEPDPEPGRLAGLTAAHNQIRAELAIAPLTWSPELARYAQQWADKLKAGKCGLKHRPGSGPHAQRYGENIFSATGQAATAEQVVASWAAEVRGYDAKTNRCRGVCGHYTQVVWRKSQRLGCGVATCGDTEVWVCNYDPPGNFVGQRPY